MAMPVASEAVLKLALRASLANRHQEGTFSCAVRRVLRVPLLYSPESQYTRFLLTLKWRSTIGAIFVPGAVTTSRFLLGPPITSAHRRTNLSIIHSTALGRDRGRNRRAMAGLAKRKGSSPTQTNHKLRSNRCFQLNSEYFHIERTPQ